MKPLSLILLTAAFAGTSLLFLVQAEPEDSKKGRSAPPKAMIDGNGPGWRALGEADFVNVNCADDTWTWREDGSVHCTGKPTGVIKSKKVFTNFELVAEWRHLKNAGNSGIFVWTIKESLDRLKGPGLPNGIEVQVLDVGYTKFYEEKYKKASDWFTCHGDVFPVGKAKMKPFRPWLRTASGVSPRKISPGVPGNGTITMCAPSMERCASGSTAKKSPAARTANPPPAFSASSPKARPSSFATYGSGNCRKSKTGAKVGRFR